MNPGRRFATPVLVLSAVILFLLADPARACAPAPPPNTHVEIAEESAIIIWDAGFHTQHFIRRAAFNTEVRDFGFLVPTPAKPILGEASDEVFSVLEKITAPRVITQTRPAGGGCIGCSAEAPSSVSAAPAVRVLEEKRVAGQDAAVLEANDPNDLSRWLKEHGYALSPGLTDWLAPYVAAGWKVTAFKIAKEAPQTPGVATSAVRMTFQTERPFFPYREPAEQRENKAEGNPHRLLRVYFFSQSRVKGTLGPKADSWPGRVAWANQVVDAPREQILGLLKLPGEKPSWLTEFEDRSSPRPGTDDVYFSPSEEQGPVERPAVVHYVTETASSYVMGGFFAAYLLAMYSARFLRQRPAGH